MRREAVENVNHVLIAVQSIICIWTFLLQNQRKSGHTCTSVGCLLRPSVVLLLFVLCQYAWFEKGFNLVSSPLLSSLTGRELQLLVCGTPELDFDELKASCK